VSSDIQHDRVYEAQRLMHSVLASEYAKMQPSGGTAISDAAR